MSAEGDQKYFCEGIAEEILNTLARIEGLRVASRTASFALAAPRGEVAEMGRKLGVSSILDGSVRKVGARLRVTVQLVDAGSGYQRWSERFDADLEDVFAIQDRIAENTVRTLGPLLGGATGDVRRSRRTSVDAYDFYLRGRQLVADLQGASLRQARIMFRRAAEIDPEYALAWCGITEASSWLFMWFGTAEEDRQAALEASARALALDPDAAEVHVSRALALMLGKNYGEAGKELQRALALDPRSFDATYYAGRVAFSEGRMEEAIDLMLRAAELRPDDFQTLGLVAPVLDASGRGEEAEHAAAEALARIDRRLAIHPADARAMYIGAILLVRRDQREAGERLLERAIAVAPDDPAILYNAGCFWVQAGDSEKALAYLERTIAQQGKGSPVADWLRHDTDFDPLRGDPRFAALLARLG